VPIRGGDGTRSGRAERPGWARGRETNGAPPGAYARLREKRAPPSSETARSTQTTHAHGRGRILACIRCGSAITTAAARIAIAGAHEHTFANPHGFLFRIGCFSSAQGCATEGPRTAEWSWFPPYSWQIEVCATCREHLGWLYRAQESRFHGFILDRLIEREGE
jgi:hypothetical protein